MPFITVSEAGLEIEIFEIVVFGILTNIWTSPPEFWLVYYAMHFAKGLVASCPLENFEKLDAKSFILSRL